MYLGGHVIRNNRNVQFLPRVSLKLESFFFSFFLSLSLFYLFTINNIPNSASAKKVAQFEETIAGRL